MDKIINELDNLVLQYPSMAFTEEYQIQLLTEHFAAYSELRQKGWFVGEMIWNFADFMTDQGTQYTSFK
jgi:hypothetical protein